jgi:hypothetical protein
MSGSRASPSKTFIGRSAGAWPLKLVPGKVREASLKGPKNDVRDAKAVAEAVQRPPAINFHFPDKGLGDFLFVLR